MFLSQNYHFYHLDNTGMSNVASYVDLDIICEPIKQREANFISTASGAVDQVIGQYYEQSELRVVGAGYNNDKVDYLIKLLDFDPAFNYKNYDDLALVLRQNYPNEIDICFVNIRGKTLKVVLEVVNNKPDIEKCGIVL